MKLTLERVGDSNKYVANINGTEYDIEVSSHRCFDDEQEIWNGECVSRNAMGQPSETADRCAVSVVGAILDMIDFEQDKRNRFLDFDDLRGSMPDLIPKGMDSVDYVNMGRRGLDPWNEEDVKKFAELGLRNCDVK